MSAQTVQQAVAAVMADLPGISKGDTSNEGYKYRGIEAVTREVQPLFAKHGVVVVPKASITDVRPSPAMKEGWTDVFMVVEWTITGPDGSTLTAQTTGIGRDRADKGANKAQTQAFKYLLLHMLCIADAKDDADQHCYEQDRAAPEPKADERTHQSLRDTLSSLTEDQLAAYQKFGREHRIPPFSKKDVLTEGQAALVLEFFDTLSSAAESVPSPGVPASAADDPDYAKNGEPFT